MDLSVILTFLPGVGWLYRRFKPLELRPNKKQISINGNNWNEEFYIFLNNRTNNPYYDVNIVSEFSKNIDVELLPTELDEASVGPIKMGLDFMIVGEDVTGDKGIQTVINNIGPGEKKKIKVRVVAKKQEKKNNIKLKFKIANFKKSPKSVFSF